MSSTCCIPLFDDNLSFLLLPSSSQTVLSIGQLPTNPNPGRRITHSNTPMSSTEQTIFGNILYDQITSFNDSRAGVAFQDYTDNSSAVPFGNLDNYDSEAADDFTVPPDVSWELTAVEIRTIIAVGFPAFKNYTIYIYQDADGTPDVNGSGRLSYMSLNVTRAPIPPGNFSFPVNNFTISFGPTPPLRSGKTYWIGLQAVGDYVTYNDTFWRLASPQTGNPAQWRNPGNGYLSNCTSFGTIAECTSSPETGTNFPDMLFRLYGKELPDTPQPTPAPTPEPSLSFDYSTRELMQLAEDETVFSRTYIRGG
jgi:hypothetical protein